MKNFVQCLCWFCIFAGVPKFESVKEPEKVPQEPAEADDAQTYGYIGEFW